MALDPKTICQVRRLFRSSPLARMKKQTPQKLHPGNPVVDCAHACSRRSGGGFDRLQVLPDGHGPGCAAPCILGIFYSALKETPVKTYFNCALLFALLCFGSMLIAQTNPAAASSDQNSAQSTTTPGNDSSTLGARSDETAGDTRTLAE